MNKAERDRLASDFRTILGFTNTGAAWWRNYILAQQHALEWQRYGMAHTDGERGGSSNPSDLHELAEDAKVAAQASRDAASLASLIPAFQSELVLARYHGGPTPELAAVSQRLAQIIARCVRVVDHDVLVEHQECRSCAREGKVGKRHFAGHPNVPVYERSKAVGLCRWCYEHLRAEGHLPPIDIIDVYHRQSPRAAGLAYARRLKANA